MNKNTWMLIATLIAVCFLFVLLGVAVIFPLVAALGLTPHCRFCCFGDLGWGDYGRFNSGFKGGSVNIELIAAIVLILALWRVRSKYPSKLKPIFTLITMGSFALLVLSKYRVPDGLQGFALACFIFGYFQGGLFTLGGESDPKN